MHVPPLPCLLLCATVLAGCAAPSVTGRARDGAAQAELMKGPRSVALRLHAAARLNVDASGRPLALLARVYTLRQNAAFEAAPYAAFLVPGADRAALGPDLIDVKDVTLVPGQAYEVLEKLPREAAYLGIVALFHAPAPQRWRLSFAAAEAETAGVTVALQGCALAAGSGARPSSAGTGTGINVNTSASSVKASAAARCP